MSNTAVSGDFTEDELDTMETELENLANSNDPTTWLDNELTALDDEFGTESESDATPTERLIQTISMARKLVADLRAGSTGKPEELQSIKNSLAAVEISSGEIRTDLERLDALIVDLRDRVTTLEQR